jgi:hypothetical protein
VQDQFTYDYAIIRIVPKVEREEFINVGVIVSCPAKAFLESRIELNEERLAALDPYIDLEFLRTNLATIPAICQGGDAAGTIGGLSQRERFYWLTAARSTIIQTSPIHTGLCKDPADALERLLVQTVRPSESQCLPEAGEARI